MVQAMPRSRSETSGEHVAPVKAPSPLPSVLPPNTLGDVPKNQRWRGFLVSFVIHLLLAVILFLLAVDTQKYRPTMEALLEADLADSDLVKNTFSALALEPEKSDPEADPAGAPLALPEEKAMAESTISEPTETLATGLAERGLDAVGSLAGGMATEDKGLGLADGIDGNGTGVGVAKFFGKAAKGRKVVYVIDRSDSMRANNAWQLAQKELVRSIQALPATMDFDVLFYNTGVVDLGTKPAGLRKATDRAKDRAQAEIFKVQPAGGTNTEAGLQSALALRPDIIFLLTDAEDADTASVKKITELNKNRTRRRTDSPASIHVIQFSHVVEGQAIVGAAIKELAEKNAGTYRLIPVALGDGN